MRLTISPASKAVLSIAMVCGICKEPVCLEGVIVGSSIKLSVVDGEVWPIDKECESLGLNMFGSLTLRVVCKGCTDKLQS